jgi:hypothetical protein
MSEVNKIKFDMFDETLVPDQHNPQPNLLIPPTSEDGLTITGIRIIDGTVTQIFAKDDELEGNEFYSFLSAAGCGTQGEGYGYGFDSEGGLNYFDQMKYKD